MQINFSEILNAGDVIRVCAPGETIFAMGDPGDRMYLILEGEIEIRVGDRVFDRAVEGDPIGEMALLDDMVRSATAVSLTESRVVAIDKPRLLQILQQHPYFAVELTKCMVRRLRLMNRSAQYDPLTQLPNRILFLELCQTALARSGRSTGHIGLLHLDLDHFEKINDSLGYAVADQLLGQVAGRLQRVLDPADTLARLGADEFAVLVESVHNDTDLAEIAQNLHDALAAPFILGKQSLYLTGSIGIACHPAEGSDIDVLMNNAASAMHSAKQAGRNQYVFFSTDISARALEFVTLKNALREAINLGELFLHYQPRVDLLSGRINGVEALARWQHAALGLVSPARFIPVAEEGGLIDDLGAFVLREGCRQRKQWLDAGLDGFRVAINLSPLQIRQADLVSRVQRILTETGLPARYLELELTESAMMENMGEVITKLGQLRSMGVEIALDDFGTGYSSLSSLKNFPIDCMKIDQSFVRGIPRDEHDMAITRTIIALARNLGLSIVIEGVETEEQMAFARREGCETYQGYLFSKPVPPEAFEKLLRAG
ncbi:MAG: EAL domain-containing protein [Sterolibacterium sp.]|nr:EAL domain-containing protein [Sterolibacterium sp.]